MKRRSMVLVACGALGLVSCGGGDDGGDGDSASVTTSADDTFCSLAPNVAALSTIVELEISSDPPDGDEIEEALSDFVSWATNAEALAPAEIKGRVAASIQGMSAMKQFLEENDYDLDADRDKLLSLVPGLTVWEREVEPFVAQNC